MISKRKKVAVRRVGRTAAKNKNTLMILGIAAAAVGTYLFAGDSIKKLFKKEPENFPPSPQLEPAIPSVTPGAPRVTTPEPAGLDIDKKLRKGSSGEEVKRLQFIINYIASLRGAKAFKTPSGYTVKYPISTDGAFGSDTQAGAFNISPQFKDLGFITVDMARKKLAYLAGYYDKPFPSELVGTKNYSEYQTAYKTGQIEAQKQ
jgi:hypothetical protein